MAPGEDEECSPGEGREQRGGLCREPMGAQPWGSCTQRVCCMAYPEYIVAILPSDVTITCSACAIRNAELISLDRFMG